MPASMTAHGRPRLRLITTGGTIAMKLDPALGAPVPALAGADLLAAVPRLAQIAEVRVDDLFNVPSVEMGESRWPALHRAVAAALASADVDGVIVSHGTDTLEESAWFLDLSLRSDKPVVLVGAQRNASEPDVDGPRNLCAAARVCAAPAARGLGVLVVMNDRIHAARDVAKWHTADVAGFHSERGALGSVVAERVLVARRPARASPLFELRAQALPRVEIVPAFAGAGGWMVHAAAQQGARGLVLQALGAGNVPRAMHDAVVDVLAAGLHVVVATRVPTGEVQPTYGFVGGGQSLHRAGAIFASDLSAHKARILLLLALQDPRSADDLQRLFAA